MPLWPSFAQVMESAARSVRLSACSVRMSGRRAPFLIPIPTPERAIAARARGSTLPCFARTLSPAAETEVVASMAAIAASAFKFILSPSNFEQVAPDDYFALVVFAHASHPHVVRDRAVVGRHEVGEDERLHSRGRRQL